MRDAKNDESLTVSCVGSNPATGLIAAIGMFDGVHVGHRCLLDQLQAKANTLGLKPCVVTFVNHPMEVIDSKRKPGLITAIEHKKELLAASGIEEIIILEFDEQLRGLTALEFAKRVLKPAGVEAVMLGFNNSFGSDCIKSAEVMAKVLEPAGIKVFSAEAFDACVVSSSLIRSHIKDGDIPAANRLLGRRHVVSGTVVHGRHIGHPLGFPTANIEPDCPSLLPRPGVYAAVMLEPGIVAGKPAMLNIGTAPTITDAANAPLTVECHIIIDANDDSKTKVKADSGGHDLNLYGKKMRVELLERLRDEKRFAGLDELKAGLNRDKMRSLEIWEREKSIL